MQGWVGVFQTEGEEGGSSSEQAGPTRRTGSGAACHREVG